MSAPKNLINKNINHSNSMFNYINIHLQFKKADYKRNKILCLNERWKKGTSKKEDEEK